MRTLVGLLSLAGLCLFALVQSARSAEQSGADAQARQSAAAAILEKHCVECHGGRLTRSGLDLTTREGLLKGGAGGLAVVAGESAKSALVERITHAVEPGMPYKRDRLNDEQIALLRGWIDDGAPYSGPLRKGENADQWWSLRPLVKPAVPRLSPIENVVGLAAL